MMLKIFTLIILFSAIFLLIIAIRNAYRVKKSINSIKNKKSYHFVIFNILIAICFVFAYSIMAIKFIYSSVDYYYLFVSTLFLLNALFIFIASIVTKQMGILLYSIDKLRKMDALTDIYNRGAIEKAIKREYNRCYRYKRDACLVMIDVNNFKSINDKYGHLAGDEVLRDLAQTIASQCRDTDMVGRYGGDEFIILLPETNYDRANFFYRRLERIILDKEINYDHYKIKYSVSTGISCLTSDYKDYLEWLRHADISLYDAKKLRQSSLQ